MERGDASKLPLQGVVVDQGILVLSVAPARGTLALRGRRIQKLPNFKGLLKEGYHSSTCMEKKKAQAGQPSSAAEARETDK
ncbi:hypothetical protein HN51_021177 [Arachis hypogaea]